MLVRDIMTAEPQFVTPDETATQAARLMRTLDIGMLPVVDTPRTMALVGVVTDRDLVVRCMAEGHGGPCDIASHMTPVPLVTVAPDLNVRDAVEAMANSQVRRLPVIAGGRLVGVVTQGDIAQKVGPTDPAMVEWMLERISRPGALATVRS